MFEFDWVGQADAINVLDAEPPALPPKYIFEFDWAGQADAIKDVYAKPSAFPPKY